MFNEKPSKEDIISATEERGAPRLYLSATIHTTMGDIHLELFPKVAHLLKHHVINGQTLFFFVQKNTFAVFLVEKRVTYIIMILLIGMSQNSGEFLCTCAQQLLQRPRLPQGHQTVHDPDWRSFRNRWIVDYLVGKREMSFMFYWWLICGVWSIDDRFNQVTYGFYVELSNNW